MLLPNVLDSAKCFMLLLNQSCMKGKMFKIFGGGKTIFLLRNIYHLTAIMSKPTIKLTLSNATVTFNDKNVVVSDTTYENYGVGSIQCTHIHNQQATGVSFIELVPRNTDGSLTVTSQDGSTSTLYGTSIGNVTGKFRMSKVNVPPPPPTGTTLLYNSVNVMYGGTNTFN